MITTELVSAARYFARALCIGQHDRDDAIGALRTVAGDDGRRLRLAAAAALGGDEGEAASELLLVAIPSLLAS